MDATINRKIKLYLFSIILLLGAVMNVQGQSKYDSLDISIKAFMAGKEDTRFYSVYCKGWHDDMVKIVWTSGYSK